MAVAATNWTISALLAIAAAGIASAQQVELGQGSVVETVTNLKPGEYVWAPSLAPSGPMLLVVNTTTQRAVLYRNGVPIGASTISTGRAGYRTPTGVFSILQKHVEHYSRKYDNAPMPYMQRLTWYGVALHAGNLPGYPASHGCIRMPLGFAKLLYGKTAIGMTVIVTDKAASPRIAPAPELVSAGEHEAAAPADATYEWHPEKSPSGPVSIIVSAMDRRAIVLRNGIEIGSAKVTIDGPATGTWAYTLRSISGGKREWLRLPLNGMDPSQPVPAEEWRRFNAAEPFRRAVAAILERGTTIIVTSDSLEAGSPGTPVTVIEDDQANGH